MTNTESSGSSRWFGVEGGRTARLMMYLLLAIVLMSIDQRGNYVLKIRSSLERTIEPVFHIVGWPARAFRYIEQRSMAREKLLTQKSELHRQLLATAASVQTQSALEKENQRLRNLLEATKGRAFRFSFAEMIRVDLDPFSHKVWIDRGANENVFTGQAVIDGLGVVGQVENVMRHSSSVRLISDPDHALPVQVNRTGLRTVVYGSGDTSRLLMPNVPLQADVSPGDIVVTSGLGDRFPAGFPVGVVEQVLRGGETFAKVYLRPLAALDRGREVLLIVPQQAEDQRLDETQLEEQELEEQDAIEQVAVENND